MTDTSPERLPDSSPSTIQGEVIRPTATAGPVAATVTTLGEVLHRIISAVPQAFHGENDQLAAHAAIRGYVNSLVKPSEKAALNIEDHRAPVEDVSQRPAPNGAAYTLPAPAAAQIDYARLAAEIVRQQQVAQNPPEVNEE